MIGIVTSSPQSLERRQESKMEDEPGTSRKSRKRKRKREKNPAPELMPKCKKKKDKEMEKKPKVVAHAQHLFRTANGCGTLSPLKISNIQDLILFVSLHEAESHLGIPKWCYVGSAGSIRRVGIVLVSGVGAVEYKKNQDCFPQCNALFEQCVETKASGPDISVRLPHESLLSVDLPNKELKRRMKEQASKDNTPLGREDYLLTTDEMRDNDYPSPEPVTVNHHGAGETKDNGFVSTKAYKGSSSESPMFAVDCEMCRTTEGMELTRISVVDESLSVVYDTLVQPSQPIVDYKTEFSGITAKTLENVTTTLAEVQKHLVGLLPPDAILLGHSLENDLRALKLHHGRVIDTSVVYGSSKGTFFKSSLRSLAKQHLKKKIQNGTNGHCSIEDAKACMELVQLKIQNGPNFGKPPIDKEGLFERTERRGRIASMLDYPGVLRKFCSGATHAIACTSDEEIVSHTVKQMETSDILWAHLHEAEMFCKDKPSNIEGQQEQTWKDVLQSVDSRIKQIHDAVPSHSLLLVILGCGDLSLVRRLQRQMQTHKAELKEAVKTAKKGLCFIKIT